jgi:hypothetical protein
LPHWPWHPLPQKASVHPQNPNWLQHWPSGHGLLPLQSWATANATALETTTKIINKSWAFIFPIPISCNREIQTTTTTTTLDAQKHELIRPQEFWTSKNRTPDLASTRNKSPQEQTSWEVKNELRVSRLCCFIPVTHH